MQTTEASPRSGLPKVVTNWTTVRARLLQNHLWQRIVKHTIVITLSITIVILPDVYFLYGKNAFLAPMTAVFSHAGRRFGQMFESLLSVFAGLFLGLGWSMLGLFISSMFDGIDIWAEYSVKAVFVLLAVLFHGYFRSKTPRLFLVVFMVILVAFTMLMGPAEQVAWRAVANIAYPVLTAAALVFFVNILIFPEFSSDYLGTLTIETLSQTETTLQAAIEWFVEPTGQQTERPASNGSVGPSELSGPNTSTRDMRSRTRLAQLTALTKAKGQLRSKQEICRATYEECSFELTYAYFSPLSLKPLSKTCLREFVRNVVMVISACESRYALVGHGDEESEDGLVRTTDPDSSHRSSSVERPRPISVSSEGEDSSSEEDLEMPTKIPRQKRREGRRAARLAAVAQEAKKMLEDTPETTEGNVELLEMLLGSVRAPISTLLGHTKDALTLVIASLAHCLELKRLPDGSPAPDGILLQEVDLRIDTFAQAIQEFEKSWVEALVKAASLEKEEIQLDVMPRQETFLVSSALLSFRQAAGEILQMLKEARKLAEMKEARQGRRKLFFPRIKLKKWLRLAGEEDPHGLPQNVRINSAPSSKGSTSPNQEVNEDGLDHEYDGSDGPEHSRLRTADVENIIFSGLASKLSIRKTGKGPGGAKSKTKAREKIKKQTSMTSRSREQLADIVEGIQHSPHFSYALKLALAVFICSWPAFYAPMNEWYTAHKASWAVLQLVMVFEVAIGPAFSTFLVRAFGVALGCFWGFLAFEISRGFLPALIIVLMIGILPSAYVQLTTPYVKAGMISIVSMAVVALATVQSTDFPAWESFLTRTATFMVGGCIALIVELAFSPVRARHRLVDSLSACVTHIIRMEAVMANGVEQSKTSDATLTRQFKRFGVARNKAQAALSNAEIFLPFCLTEPRLKGEFNVLYPIYKDIIYVLHQVVDRMENMIALRKAYGSSGLDYMNSELRAYRRNVAASVTLTLFTVNEALITKQPMPQYLPSCRVAHKRLVYRIRELLQPRTTPINTISSPWGLSRPSTQPSTPRHSATNLAFLGRPTLHRGHSAMSVTQLDETTARRATQPQLLSWNAMAAGRLDIIEFLEELVHCTKRLVGENSFRSGMLQRPSYRNYIHNMTLREQSVYGHAEDVPLDSFKGYNLEVAITEESMVLEDGLSLRSRRRTTGASVRPSVATTSAMQAPPRAFHVRSNTASEEELPASLQSVGPRLRERRSLIQRLTRADIAPQAENRQQDTRQVDTKQVDPKGKGVVR